MRRTATRSRLCESLYCWDHAPSLIASKNKSRVYRIVCLYTLCGTRRVSPALARSVRCEPNEHFDVALVSQGVQGFQHCVPHLSLGKGPGRGTSLLPHRNVLTDWNRPGIALCVLVSGNADSTFLLLLFKECVGLQCAAGEVRVITDCSSVSGAARGEEDANCTTVSLWIRKGREAGGLKMWEV